MPIVDAHTSHKTECCVLTSISSSCSTLGEGVGSVRICTELFASPQNCISSPFWRPNLVNRQPKCCPHPAHPITVHAYCGNQLNSEEGAPQHTTARELTRDTHVKPCVVPWGLTNTVSCSISVMVIFECARATTWPQASQRNTAPLACFSMTAHNCMARTLLSPTRDKNSSHDKHNMRSPLFQCACSTSSLSLL
jgi:hypothetical protein